MSDEQNTSEPQRPNEWALYEQIAAPFERTHVREGAGGIKLEYIDGEQCVSRLNELLGFMNWSFVILEHGIHAEADECWVLGELTVILDERIVKRQQFGSQKVKRSRSSGTPLDIGFDLKGAATDALKKCATLIGCALYLYEKDAPTDRVASPGNVQGGSGTGPMPSSGSGGSTAGALGVEDALTCEECGESLTETRFKDNTQWSASQLAVFGRRKHGKILDMKCYREANQAKRRAEENAQGAAF